MPTRQEQGDLFLAALGGHGEIQRIVLAPVSVSDCFTQAINAFNLSEQFQMPVILMGDTTLGVRTESIPTPDLSQYQIVNRLGINGHEANGSNGANGDRAGHRERLQAVPAHRLGHLADGDPGPGGRPVRRHRPGAQRVGPAALGREQPPPDDGQAVQQAGAGSRRRPPAHYYGDQDADVGILCWGSTWGTVVEAIDVAAKKGLRVAAMAPRMVWPLPDHQLLPFIESKRVVLVPEMNYSGQFAQLMRARYLRDVVSVTDYSGGVFTVARLVQEIEGVHQHAR